MELIENPTEFLTESITHSDQFLSLCSSYFQDLKSNNHEAIELDELYTSGFDMNQIWEQIQLANAKSADLLADLQLDFTASQPLESVDGEAEKNQETEEEDSEEEEEIEEEDGDLEVEEELEEYEEELSDPDELTKKPKKKSVVDDAFFSLEEMEKFADISEAQDMKMAKKLQETNDEDDEEDEEEEGIFSIGKDLATGEFDFEEDEEDDNANDIRYEDFFAAPDRDQKPRKNWKDEMQLPEQEEEAQVEEIFEGVEEKADEEEGDEFAQLLKQEYSKDKTDLFEDEEREDTKLSTFEKHQRKLQQQIQEFESELVAQKEWTMVGEVGSKQRPKNSLLEQDLDVDIAVKPAPVITEETTKTLEQIILQRIKDQAFDDVVRKAPPKDSAFDPNRRRELDDEKSKKSLAELYEEDYNKKRGQEQKTAQDVELEAKHQEINELMTGLFHQLDALANWHYTPKPATLELKVVPNGSTPAIALEEVIPVNVSTADAALPQEVFKGIIRKSQAELTKEDKKHNLRKSKRKAGLEQKERERAKKLKTDTTTQETITKTKAMKELMKQENVTLIDAKTKQKGKATKIQAGGKIEKIKPKGL